MSESLSTYVAIHRHAHGHDTHIFKADWFPDASEVWEALEIDYEPEKGEDLEVEILFPHTEIPILFAKDILKKEAE